MVNFNTFYILKEGGNVFKTLPKQRINRQDVEPTVKFLSEILNINLTKNLLGSAGKKDTSGDIDIAIDLKKYEKDDIIEKLTNWCLERNLKPEEFIAKTGISVHFRCPIANNEGFVQVDLMWVPDVKFAKFAYASDEEEPLKARHRHIVISDIAKSQGYKWRNVEGLYSLETGNVVEAYNPDKVAQLLFADKTATATDLKTVPNIIKFLKRKYTDQEVISLLSSAKNTIEEDGVNLNDYIVGTINEAISNRKGIAHLYSYRNPNNSMPYDMFINFIGALDKSGGVITSDNSIATEKADGLAIRFGINDCGKFFIQSSYSGPVTDGKFEGKIKYPPVRAAFESNFSKIKRLVYKDLKRYCEAMELNGIVIHAEWLYSPLAIQRNDDNRTVYFVATNYQKDKLGTWSTFPIINITDYNGNELTDNAQELVTKTLQDLSNSEVIFLPLNIPIFEPIDLTQEIDKVKQAINIFAVQQPGFEKWLKVKTTNREQQKKKKDIKTSLTQVLLPYQKEMHEKIYSKLASLAGKLGDIEGIVIKFKSANKDIVFKVINPSYKNDNI